MDVKAEPGVKSVRVKMRCCMVATSTPLKEELLSSDLDSVDQANPGNETER